MVDRTLVFNMDCLPAMREFPDKYFDLAIVDPPYGLGSSSFNTAKSISSTCDDKQWNNEIPTPGYFEELHRVSKHQIIWGCNYYAKFIPAVGRIVHYKNHTPYIKNGRTISDCDLASQSFNRTIDFVEYQWSGNVQNGRINWNNDGLDGRIHPTQKPVHLYKWLLKNYAKEGDKILDTHLGSQSSRIAAFEMGFDFTGYELDREYFEAGCKRFAQHKSQIKIDFHGTVA